MPEKLGHFRTQSRQTRIDPPGRAPSLPWLPHLCVRQGTLQVRMVSDTPGKAAVAASGGRLHRAQLVHCCCVSRT